MLALLLAVALAADGGTAVYYRIPAGASLDLHDGVAPVVLPKSYLLPEPAFNAVDAELKRLQSLERVASVKSIDVPVQGYLIMAAVVAGVFFVGGLGAGYYLSTQGHK